MSAACRPSDRDDPRSGSEENTFHQFHLNLHMLHWEGMDLRRALLTWKVPLAPPYHPTPAALFPGALV